MNQSGLQSRINRGMGRAAAVLGAPHGLYRPVDPLNPIVAPPLRLLQAKFESSHTFGHAKPARRNDPVCYLLADATDLAVGDYLIGPEGRFFVASTEPNVPVGCIRCNRTVRVLRPAGNSRPGLNPPGGRRDRTDVALMADWPASVLRGGSAQAGAVGLPADARMGGVVVLLPPVEGVTIRTSDRVVDDLGTAYTVGAAELTGMGWRLDAATSEV